MHLGRILFSAVAALGPVACVQMPEPQVRVDPVVAHAVLAKAASHVRTCYRAPRVPQSARQIVTRLAVRLNADGTLAELPVVVSQSGVDASNSADARRMAEAASLAIIRCAPFSLPAEHYPRIWQNIELTFSPSRRV